eukprot:GHVL01019987.1.p1 GENE.GHVL01019987.1~~GHVL01019987.1.p1  ORF type:complete len:1734 (-),score=284.62 GHVL01019987.1:446-5647(-)
MADNYRSYSVIDRESLAFYGSLSKKPKSLDFSAPSFYLESIAGLLSIDLSRLQTLDISNNNIVEILPTITDGMKELRILRARHNRMTKITLNCPLLIELTISNNILTNIPYTKGIPQLKILNLSYNDISGSDFSVLNELNGKLTDFDISYNKLMINPSQLEDMLKVLQTFHQLSNLRLLGNPFCEIFRPYQIYCVKSLRSLQKLDNLKLTKEARAEVDRAVVVTPDRYEELFKKNQEALERQATTVDKTPKSVGITPFSQLHKLVEDCIRNPDRLSKNCTTLESRCLAIDEISNIKDYKTFTSDLQPKAIENMAISFIQIAQLLIERAESIRLKMFRCIIILSAIPSTRVPKVGDLCTGAIKMYLSGSYEVSKDVETVIKERIAKIIAIDDFTNESTIQTIKSLTVFCDNKEIACLLSVCLDEEDACALTNMCQWFVDCASAYVASNTNVNELRILASFLSASLGGEPRPGINFDEFNSNVRVLVRSTPSVPLAVANLVKQDQIDETDDLLFIKLMRIIMHCGRPRQNNSCDIFFRLSLHRELAERVNATDSGKSKSVQMELVTKIRRAALFDALIALMKNNAGIMKESIGKYRILDWLILDAANPTPDLILLTSALNGIRGIITSDLTTSEQMENYIILINQTFDNFLPFLEYLKGSRLQQAWEDASRQLKVKGAIENGIPISTITFDQYTAPPLISELYNPLLLMAYIAIIDLIACVSMSELLECKKISDILNNNNRDLILFALLEIPSDAIKRSVMECLQKVDTEQLDTAEIGLLIKEIAETKSIGAGDTEKVLSLAIHQLQRLVHASNVRSGRIWREDHAGATISEILEVLLRNSQRNTHFNKGEETEKTSLSVSAVSFIQSVSLEPDLRHYLTAAECGKKFKNILYYEEKLNTPNNQDIIIERTWIGRSMAVLAGSLLMEKPLNRRSKIAFRVVNRMADVLEGWPSEMDSPVTPPIYVLDDLIKRETAMWTLETVRQRQFSMDEASRKDMLMQRAAFMKLHSPDRILTYLLDDDAPRGPVSRSWSLTSEGDPSDLSFVGRSCKVEDASDSEKFLSDLMNRQSNVKLKGEPTIDPIEESPEDDWNEFLSKCLSRCPTMIENETIFVRFTNDCLGCPLDSPWQNLRKGVLWPTCIIVAYLRCLHAILCFSKRTQFQADLIISFRSRSVQLIRRLIALVRGCKFAEMNVAAKLMRILSVSLELSPDETSFTSNTAVIYDIVCKFVHDVLNPLDCYLRGKHASSEKGLTEAEQIICVEATRLLSIVAFQTRKIKFSPNLDMQKECVALCLDRFTPRKIIKQIMKIASWCLNVDAATTAERKNESEGGASKDVGVDAVTRRRDLRHYLMRFLAIQLLDNASLKYKILEEFCRAEIYLFTKVRASFLQETLIETTRYRFARQMERQLKSNELLIDAQACSWIRITTNPRDRATVEKRVLVLTNLNLYLIKPLRSKSDSMFLNLEGTVIPIEKKWTLTQIKKMMPFGVGSQAWVIQVVDKLGKAERDDMECFIFHQSKGSKWMLQQMLNMVVADAYSLPSYTWALHDETMLSDVILSTCALDADGHLCVYVLGPNDFCQLQINFQAWKVPSFNPTAIKLNKPIQEIKNVGTRSSSLLSESPSMRPFDISAALAADSAKPERTASCGGWNSSCTGRPKHSNGKILSVCFQAPLDSLQEINFVGKEEATVNLTFSKGRVTVTFLDDSVREDWRCFMGTLLRDSTKSRRVWTRAWNQQ